MSDKNMLPSWNDGATRDAILDFVQRTTKEGSPDFLPPEARIAVFDNDGTLWCEKPYPIQAGMLFAKLGEQVKADPSLASKQPWKAVAEGDSAWMGNAITRHYNGDDSDLRQMAAGLLAAFKGEEVRSFAKKAEAYLRGGENPVLKRPYLKTAYQPMCEVLRLLEDNGFTNYVVSGGGRDFMRTITMELYGIPRDRAIGTTVEYEYGEVDGRAQVLNTGKLDVFDDGPAKVVGIWNRIGAKPVFAGGNANGDLPMMKLAVEDGGFALLVNHDDDKRDIAYTAGAETAVETARASGWAVASVKDDWKTVFVD